MPLDPQVAAFLASHPPAPEWSRTPLSEVREAVRQRARFAGTPEPVEATFDTVVPSPSGDIPVRAYRPTGAQTLPVLVYLHGSGWTVGDLELFDAPCRALANATGWLVLSVDYRLSPEHRFPVPLDDCVAVLGWAAAGGLTGADASRVAVCGSSSGGNLAAAAALVARDQGRPHLDAQVLVYPPLDHRFDTSSYREFGPGNLPWYWSNYLGDPSDGASPYASPLRAPTLAGLPRTLVVSAEVDALRDEAEAYGRRLEAEGVPVRVTRYEGMIHGFFSMGGVFDRTRTLMKEIASFLNQP